MKNIKLKYLCNILIIISILFIPKICIAQELFFIYGEMNSEISRNTPFPIEIVSVNSTTSKLESIWEIGLLELPVFSIKLFNSLDRILIMTSKIGFKSIIPLEMDKFLLSKELITDTNNPFYYHVYVENKDDIILQFIYTDTLDKKIKSSFQSLITNKSIQNYGTANSNIILSGLAPSYGSPEHDIISLRIDSIGKFSSKSKNINISLPPVNQFKEEILRRKHWSLIANEDNYLAVSSLKAESKESKGLLLIFDKKKLSWDSLSIEGTETSLRIRNEFLCGNIAYIQIEEDKLGNKYRVASKISEDVIIVDPLTLHNFTVHLGENCEVLWIDDNDDVYYRLDDSLYKAKIENNDFVDKQLLITDSKIRHIHWAFRGSPGE